MMNRAEFFEKVNKLIPADTKIFCSVTLAQALVESADRLGNPAESYLTKRGNALFGIKAGKNWTGKRLSCSTFEVFDGNRLDIVDAFRAYDSWAQSVADHERFLTVENRTRYLPVVNAKTPAEACSQLQRCGYATAPAYAATLMSIIKTYNLYQYDGQAPAYHDGTIRQGTKGEAVRAVQARLRVLGYPCGAVDGICGAKTIEAVKTYQSANGLAVDGLCGKNTWTSLFMWR